MSQTGEMKCKQCGKSFNSETELRDHERTAHRQGGSPSSGAGEGNPPGGGQTTR